MTKMKQELVLPCIHMYTYAYIHRKHKTRVDPAADTYIHTYIQIYMCPYLDGK